MIQKLTAKDRARLAELEAKDETKLTSEEKAELEELRADSDRDEADQDDLVVQTSVRLPQSLYERVRDLSKSEHISFNQALVRTLETYAKSAGAIRDPHQDLRSLCELEKMFAETTNPQIRTEIARRVKRQYGVDLNNGGGNGNREIEQQFERYQKAGGIKFKNLEAWRKASTEDRAKALNTPADEKNKSFWDIEM